jgi:hypothetical protein
MNRDELQTIAKASPFRPSTLVTESSGQYNIEHPDYIDFPPLPEPEIRQGTEQGGSLAIPDELRW